MTRLVDVAVFAPLEKPLTYSIPAKWNSEIKAGMRVVVPLSARQCVGVVVDDNASGENLGGGKARAILEVLDTEPLLSEELLDFLKWSAGYYLAPLGEIIRAALPAGMSGRAKRQLAITDQGKAALAAQDAILRSQQDELDEGECKLLRAVVGGAKSAPKNQQSAIRRLVARGFLEEFIGSRDAPKVRQETFVRIVEGFYPESVKRAPAQRRLMERLVEAGGYSSLALLSEGLTDARALAKKLAEKGLLTIERVAVRHDPFADQIIPPDPNHELTDEQQAALERILAALAEAKFKAFLLHGITGSGKTEVYLKAIARVIETGATALVLVPEISLTPQLAARFRARFGEAVAVLHSGLTSAQRLDQWRRIHSRELSIVVGARSAIFAPLHNLKMIIVDEEHDGSFKQEEGVRYNARDLALARAHSNDAIAILGSATPSMESYHGQQEGRLDLLELRRRPTPSPLPAVELVDLRRFRTGKHGVFSSKLAEAVEKTVEDKGQVILFLNRRGYAPLVICSDCGSSFHCEHCSVTLTHHRGAKRLVCHYCGYSIALPSKCPACQNDQLDLRGFGTERIERALLERWPDIRVGRLDRDTATSDGLRTILDRFARREFDVLVGTQMVTKGHDFPGVTLVGVICADLGLQFPDFRASERTFQLMTQVAGRAGRAERPGRVLIQTYSPEHASVLTARDHDYLSFFRQEIIARRELGYPPIGHLISIRIDGEDVERVRHSSIRLAEDCADLAREKAVQLLGPSEAPLQRLKGRTRWLLLLKGRNRQGIRMVARKAMLTKSADPGVRITVDVDPYAML